VSAIPNGTAISVVDFFLDNPNDSKRTLDTTSIDF